MRSGKQEKTLTSVAKSESGLGTFKPSPLAQHPELLFHEKVDKYRRDVDETYQAREQEKEEGRLNPKVSLDVLKRLVALANILDTKGLTKEADIVDSYIERVR